MAIAATFSAQLNDCDSVQNWIPRTTGSNSMQTPTINTTGQYEGNACLNLEFYGSGPTAEIENFIIGTKDISVYDTLAFNWFISDANLSAITAMRVKIGTSTAAYNYWDLTPAQYSALADPASSSWRQVNLTGLTTTNTSGSIDSTNINFLAIELVANAAFSAFAASGTVRLDNWKVIKHFDFVSDVELDGVGYMLQPGTYNYEDQPYSVDRFSTGDVTYSNFDIYQFHAQTDWSGGLNDEYGINSNTFWDGTGIDASEKGQITNLLRFTDITAAASTGIVTSIQEYNGSAFIGVSSGAASAKIYSWVGSGSTLTLQRTVAKSALIDQTVFQGNLWASFGNPHSTTNTMEMFDGASWSSIAQSGMFFAELGNSLYTMDTASVMHSFDGSTWTTEYTQTGWFGHRMVTWNDKIYYLASTPYFNYYQQERCALFSYDGVDRLKIYEWDDWCKNSIALWKNKLWFIIGGILTSYDGESIVQELNFGTNIPKELSFDIFSNLYTTGNYAEVGNGIQSFGDKLCVVNNSGLSSNFQNTILTNYGEGFVRSTVLGGNSENYSALGKYSINNRKHLLFGTTLAYIGTEQLKGDLFDSSYEQGVLISSWIDADLFSVDKTLFSITLTYKSFSTLSASNSFEAPTAFLVMYKLNDDSNNWSILGSVNKEDINTTSKEILFPSNTVAKKFKILIILGRGFVQTGNYSNQGSYFQFGSLNQVTLNNVAYKYIVSPDTKKKWNFGVILSNNTLLNSSIRDSSNGYEKSILLWASRIKKKRLTYKDIDNQIYNVIVNDVKVQGPLAQTGRDSIGTNPEYVASIELLEG